MGRIFFNANTQAGNIFSGFDQALVIGEGDKPTTIIEGAEIAQATFLDGPAHEFGMPRTIEVRTGNEIVLKQERGGDDLVVLEE